MAVELHVGDVDVVFPQQGCDHGDSARTVMAGMDNQGVFIAGEVGGDAIN